MAQFKHVPGGSSSGQGYKFWELDPVSAGLVEMFFYWAWPVILGAGLYFVLVMKGYKHAALGLTIPVLLMEAWQYGLFG